MKKGRVAELLFVLIVAIVLWWLLQPARKPPTAYVELGDPTVTGSGSEDLGGADYLTKNAASSTDVEVN